MDLEFRQVTEHETSPYGPTVSVAGLGDGHAPGDELSPWLEPVLTSASAVIRSKPFNGFDGVEIWGKGADKALRPGSMTKLLTAYTGLLWLKRLKALDVQLVCRPEDATGGSANNLVAGDILHVDDALANMGLPSSNVTTSVWARTIGSMILEQEEKKGSGLARFVAEMNTVSKALCMKNSRWGNPSGLDGGNNLSSARDLALLCEISDQNHPEISRIWSKAKLSVTVGGPQARKIVIAHSANFIRNSSHNVTWGKTGTTRASGCSLLCEVKAPKGDRYYYVAFGAPTNADRYADASAVLDAAEKGIDWPNLVPVVRRHRNR